MANHRNVFQVQVIMGNLQIELGTGKAVVVFSLMVDMMEVAH